MVFPYMSNQALLCRWPRQYIEKQSGEATQSAVCMWQDTVLRAWILENVDLAGQSLMSGMQLDPEKDSTPSKAHDSCVDRRRKSRVAEL